MTGAPTLPVRPQTANGNGRGYSDAEPYDYVIIGSGFGGSVSAWRLTEKGYRVLVIERGKRFNAEDFPKNNWNIFKYLWIPKLRCFGFQGLFFFKDMWLLNGSGVGGGSLVYASTHRMPPDEFFLAEEWCHLADWMGELKPYYEVANRMLGTAANPRFWPADHALAEIAGELGRSDTFETTPVGIYFGEPGVTVPDPYFDGDGPTRTGCIHCGGCMVGCKHNAKNTLDKNYLFLAEKFGAEVLPESDVFDIRPLYGRQYDDARYEVAYERITDWAFKRQGRVRARNVIVAGGVVGTVDLLLRCRDETGSLPLLSSQVGRSVRSNTEALMGVTARDTGRDYSQGVAISSHFWVDDMTSVEPVRYPPGSSFMRNLIWPASAHSSKGFSHSLLESLKVLVRQPMDFVHTRLKPAWAERDTVLLIMQTLQTKMSFRRERSPWTLWRRGLVTERDPNQPIPAVVEEGKKVAERFADKVDGVPWMGFNDLLNIPNTAHILGGCTMGLSDDDGVINDRHEVFNYPGLYVADGSAVPACLGVNPSLTIAAMTERMAGFIPPKGEAPPVVPLKRPELVTIGGHPVRTNEAAAANGRLRAVAPLLAVLAALLPLLMVFAAWRKR